MKIVFTVLVCINCLSSALSITSQQALAVGKKIWRNESNQSHEKLTWWIKGEQWASLGIGHFIWYPSNLKHDYVETFPALLIHLHNHGIKLPAWLYTNKPQPCPWQTHEDFFKDFNSIRMQELRTLLESTIELQALFIIENFKNTLDTMLATLPHKERAHIHTRIDLLANNPQGMYAMIDYANFKGFGTNINERYKDKGWGLLQVLQCMQHTKNSIDAVQEFERCAKQLLTERVANAPAHRNEQQWLPGWINRIHTYTA